MSTGESSRKARGLTLSAFVLEGIAALGFLAMLAVGGGRLTSLDGFVLWALVIGFLSALGSTLIAVPHSERVSVRITQMPERRHVDRRVLDLGSPTGIERRTGRDRRIAQLTASL